MKVAMFGSIASPPDGEHIEERLEEICREAVLAESCGFDGIFFGEHHQDKKRLQSRRPCNLRQVPEKFPAE